jgi:hypothetical protein
MTRVLIIALDGLEPTQVTEDMPHLLQVEHGTVDINVSPLVTPLVWAAFLTGATANGVKILKFPYALDEKISRMIGVKRVAKVNEFSSKLGLSNFFFTKADLTLPTIFELSAYPIALNIPSYNENPAYLDVRRNITYALRGQISEEAFVDHVWALFREEYAECQKRLDDDWELFMVHFFVTDVIGHLGWDDPETLQACYRTMDACVAELQRRVHDAVILILSDHGMQNGLHTRNGFYSVNQELHLNTPKITDFYAILRDALRHTNTYANNAAPLSLVPAAATGNPHNDKSKVIRHLRELGYV